MKADDADPAIIAVEIDEDNLYPDEDFIAQCLCLANNGDWKTTRRSVHPYLFQSHWKESLAYNGVACSQSISPQQILDYRVIPWKGNGELLLAIGAAALPTTTNFFIYGQLYRECISLLFSEETLDEAVPLVADLHRSHQEVDWTITAKTRQSSQSHR